MGIFSLKVTLGSTGGHSALRHGNRCLARARLATDKNRSSSDVPVANHLHSEHQSGGGQCSQISMGSTSRLARGSACLEEDANILARTALAHHTLRHLASFECIVEPELVIEPEPANVRVSADPLDAGQVLDLGGRWGLDSWE